MQFPGDLRSVAASTRASGNAQRVAYADDVISQVQVTALSSLFPTLGFEPIGTAWPEHFAHGVDILIIGISASSGQQVERAVNFLRNRPSRLQVLVALRDADVVSSRALARAGAADVISMPASEATWALSLERLL